MTSDDYPASHRPPTRFLPMLWNRSLIWLHHLSSNRLIAHLALAIFPKSSATRSSIQLSRSRGSMLQTSVLYRPISNLSVFIEAPGAPRSSPAAQLFDDRWSLTNYTVGFRAGHSTETAVLCVLSDILHAVDHGDVAALVFWTYQPLLIRLTMISSCSDYIRHSRHRSAMDQIVSVTPDAVRTSWT